MLSRFKQLGKDTLIYGVGNIFAKGIGFFMLPILTRIFSPSDYGIIEMLAVIGGFLTAILIMGMDSAQSYFFVKEEKNGLVGQAEVVSSVLKWNIVWGLLVLVGAVLCSPLINKFIFDGKLSIAYFILSFGSVYLSIFVSQATNIFRLTRRAWDYVWVSTSQSIIFAVLVLVLVIYFSGGILGYLWGMALSSLLVVGISIYIIREYVVWNSVQSGRLLKKLLRFGAPLVPGGIGAYLLTTSDRWIIFHWLSASELGVYSVGVKFALMVGIAIGLLRQTWLPFGLDSLKTVDGLKFFRSILTIYIHISLIGVILLQLISPWLLGWLVPSEFWDAATLVGILTFGIVFEGLYMMFAIYGLWKSEKTLWLSIYPIGAAFLNIFLSILLLHFFDIFGVAIATAIVFIIKAMVTLHHSERYLEIDAPYLNIYFVTSIAFFVVLFISAMGSISTHSIAATLISLLLISLSLKFSLVRLRTRQVAIKQS